MSSHIAVDKPRAMRGISPTFVMWAEPGSDVFRRAVKMAKDFAWPDGDKCPWCGKVMREHDPERCE